MERFNRTVLDEFFRTAFREKFYDSLQALQKDLDKWLHHYNYEHPHRGYRNKGRKPIETFEMGEGPDERNCLNTPTWEALLSGNHLTFTENGNNTGNKSWAFKAILTLKSFMLKLPCANTFEYYQ